jgi:hypothetical protein
MSKHKNGAYRRQRREERRQAQLEWENQNIWPRLTAVRMQYGANTDAFMRTYMERPLGERNQLRPQMISWLYQLENMYGNQASQGR